MKKEYDSLFNKQTILLTKGVVIDDIIEYPLTEGMIKLLYVGNLQYGRFEELMNIAQSVNEANQKCKNRIQFDIYTQTEQADHAFE
jgi:hypothetical protein